MEIQNYPNYLIYNDGRVYSKNRNRFMKSQLNSRGYYQVILWKNNKGKNIPIHRLVALHYIALIDGKDEVDHIDRNKTNNDISNLRWVNRSENAINRRVQSNNKCGHKCIRLTRCNTYEVRIKRNCKTVYNKNFKTLEEAIVARDNYVETLVPQD